MVVFTHSAMTRLASGVAWSPHSSREDNPSDGRLAFMHEVPGPRIADVSPGMGPSVGTVRSLGTEIDTCAHREWAGRLRTGNGLPKRARTCIWFSTSSPSQPTSLVVDKGASIFSRAQ
ncbi:predicted protein [Aspergillus terreus NIH2624]|uniref:Uncharacterized protein n=1 Tax=Aspergillus terreus (strain NIH 2624 / FGSC A1156) TaxID=341663 RepID=Q0CWB0_ASPTN|nr:uncharacterized protein ATEG_02024 [Aspergillus terreus NIH2624]EAU36986.1 predicted protein [Aspergillus terreus NIH2624]